MKATLHKNDKHFFTMLITTENKNIKLGGFLWKKRIIAVIIGMSAILTCSPVLANNKPIVKHVNDVKLAEKSAKVPFNTSNPNILNGNKKLGKPEVKLNEDSLKKFKS